MPVELKTRPSSARQDLTSDVLETLASLSALVYFKRGLGPPQPTEHPMAYTQTEAREQILEGLVGAIDEIGVALACVTAAYEQLDDQSAERLEDRVFGPVQRAYGKAKRTHAEYAARVGTEAQRFGAPAPPPASLKARELIQQGAQAALRADESLSDLQSEQALVEVGDVELRRGIGEVRESISAVPRQAAELLRTLGR